MFDSGPFKALNFVASIITVLTALGGGWVGVTWKGDEWGEQLSAAIFFFATGFVVYFIILFGNVLAGKLRRTCPVCKGVGTVMNGYDEIMRPQKGICPKCKGDGLIF